MCKGEVNCTDQGEQRRHKIPPAETLGSTGLPGAKCVEIERCSIQKETQTEKMMRLHGSDTTLAKVHRTNVLIPR